MQGEQRASHCKFETRTVCDSTRAAPVNTLGERSPVGKGELLVSPQCLCKNHQCPCTWKHELPPSRDMISVHLVDVDVDLDIDVDVDGF